MYVLYYKYYKASILCTYDMFNKVIDTMYYNTYRIEKITYVCDIGNFFYR